MQLLRRKSGYSGHVGTNHIGAMVVEPKTRALSLLEKRLDIGPDAEEPANGKKCTKNRKYIVAMLGVQINGISEETKTSDQKGGMYGPVIPFSFLDGAQLFKLENAYTRDYRVETKKRHHEKKDIVLVNANNDRGYKDKCHCEREDTPCDAVWSAKLIGKDGKWPNEECCESGDDVENYEYLNEFCHGAVFLF